MLIICQIEYRCGWWGRAALAMQEREAQWTAGNFLPLVFVWMLHCIVVGRRLAVEVRCVCCMYIAVRCPYNVLKKNLIVVTTIICACIISGWYNVLTLCQKECLNILLWKNMYAEDNMGKRIGIAVDSGLDYCSFNVISKPFLIRLVHTVCSYWCKTISNLHCYEGENLACVSH